MTDPTARRARRQPARVLVLWFLGAAAILLSQVDALVDYAAILWFSAIALFFTALLAASKQAPSPRR
ncbi:hypothetical protein Xcel_0832 [Xylanimonas cellulosilytica DSM 15894]|uniref:Uncharacterized protein n=1 Tax=Xylanimonas cellulosilytica (strain DSM 15894 / JCM 12276 / CECT 5975 / KCTC 9989 / LMG 20990 / NBRC 107835 / XIL07) TaxID=446471 RepID=D1BY24_XYLCX|nr:hypothetical protein [Xylanimonas cellulosilytica]ACZ29867.1 hypothetical protein Xcel_0832 [Xylanimonas cellulosilytica DSM 15894]